MKYFLILITLLSSNLYAKNIIRIEVDKDSKGESVGDLKRRVWMLERAVVQLQETVFHLQANAQNNQAASWLCTVKGFGEEFSGVGNSKAVASLNATKACKAKGKEFFCGDPKCTNE